MSSGSLRHKSISPARISRLAVVWRRGQEFLAGSSGPISRERFLVAFHEWFLCASDCVQPFALCHAVASTVQYLSLVRSQYRVIGAR